MLEVEGYIVYSQKAMLKKNYTVTNIRTGEILDFRPTPIKVTVFYNVPRYSEKYEYGWFVGQDDQIYIVHKKYIEPLEEKVKVNYKKAMKNRRRHFYDE